MRAPGHGVPSPARRRALIGILLGLGIVYLACMPMLRRMSAETARIERETAANQAEAARLASLRTDLDTARARAAQQPGDGQVRLDLARRCDALGQPEEAAHEAEIAAALRPKDPEPVLLLASLHQRAHRYDAAESAYRAALAMSPNEPRAAAGLAGLYSALGWPLPAEEVLLPALRAAPDNPQLKIALALAYLQHREMAEAERLLLEVRRQAPEEATLWSPLAHLYNEGKRHADAARVAGDALAKLPGNVPLRNELGKARYFLGDVPVAMVAFREALQIQPDNAMAHAFLGLCHQKLNQSQEAIRELEAVMRIDPGLGETRLVLGRLYLQVGREAEGRRLLEEFRRARAARQEIDRLSYRVSTQPRSAGAHWQLALCYQRQGERPRMIAEARKTLELAPQHPGAERLLAEAERQESNPPRASR